jgi:hypothetical protein
VWKLEQELTKAAGMEVPNELRHELLVLPNQVRFTDHNQLVLRESIEHADGDRLGREGDAVTRHHLLELQARDSRQVAASRGYGTER